MLFLSEAACRSNGSPLLTKPTLAEVRVADKSPIAPKPRRQSSKTTEQRFWEKVSPEPNSGCWLWTASGNDKGYGVFYFREAVRLAHIASYEMHVGKVPDGLELDHKCRVRGCVNPDHLEPVTHTENLRRGNGGAAAKVRQKSIAFCPKGHPYVEGNMYIRKNGYRDCAICARSRKRIADPIYRANISPERREELRAYWREYYWKKKRARERNDSAAHS